MLPALQQLLCFTGNGSYRRFWGLPVFHPRTNEETGGAESQSNNGFGWCLSFSSAVGEGREPIFFPLKRSLAACRLERLLKVPSNSQHVELRCRQASGQELHEGVGEDIEGGGHIVTVAEQGRGLTLRAEERQHGLPFAPR